MINARLKHTIDQWPTAAPTAARKLLLNQLRDYIQEKVSNGLPVKLVFICTHNSRRSHLAQVWAQVLAAHFEIPNLEAYSGGTEVTALFPEVAKTLTSQGFEIHKETEGSNPTYHIRYEATEKPIVVFSKKYDAAQNPTTNFAAIMTCSSADLGCPLVHGAEMRLALTYEDPKLFDNSPQQAEKYLERSVQIGAELYAVFSTIKVS